MRRELSYCHSPCRLSLLIPRKPAELKKCLYCLFSQFGKIADVQCCKTNKLRGQAWIIFADVASATNALQCMNGFPFFEKKLVRTLLSSSYFSGLGTVSDVLCCYVKICLRYACCNVGNTIR